MTLKKPQKNTPRVMPNPPLRKAHFSLQTAMTPVQQRKHPRFSRRLRDRRQHLRMCMRAGKTCRARVLPALAALQALHQGRASSAIPDRTWLQPCVQNVASQQMKSALRWPDETWAHDGRVRRATGRVVVSKRAEGATGPSARAFPSARWHHAFVAFSLRYGGRHPTFTEFSQN